MKVSPLRTEFFMQSTIDRQDNITVLPRQEPCGWLLSSPSTAVFSSMHLNSPLRSQQHQEDDAMAKVESRTIACQESSPDFADGCSISCSSEDSDSWLMEDMFEQSHRNTSTNNSHSSYGSYISQLEDEEYIWGLWDTRKDMVSPEPLHHPNTSKPAQVREQGDLGAAQKLPSQMRFDTTKSRKTTQLKRHSATRSPHRIARTRLDPPSPAGRKAYSPFPPRTPPVPDLHQDYHMKYHSWPVPTKPEVRPQRLRANTTPTPTVQSVRKVNRPSNLSTCVTLEQNDGTISTDNSVPLSMCSAPTSPQFPPLPGRDLLDLMVETSAFSDDEDDENHVPAFVLAMKSVLKIGRGDANVEGEKLSVVETKKIASKKTLRGALGSLLKLKKGATL
ncbi:hypothetical protein BKA65DRAFT_507655 [Rhexocercosporidium sp. MPI-PUGE-AT-0058]|nr:hypothetical protein BKA65DRAFT_507655 [Rhexocercosporidium sp. MPI-PUGE-AT-0058]